MSVDENFTLFVLYFKQLTHAAFINPFFNVIRECLPSTISDAEPKQYSITSC